MKIIMVYWIRRKFFTTVGPIEEVAEEMLLDMGDLGILVPSGFRGHYNHYHDLDHYLKHTRDCVVNPETDIEVVELGEV